MHLGLRTSLQSPHVEQARDRNWSGESVPRRRRGGPSLYYDSVRSPGTADGLLMSLQTSVIIYLIDICLQCKNVVHWDVSGIFNIIVNVGVGADAPCLDSPAR